MLNRLIDDCNKMTVQHNKIEWVMHDTGGEDAKSWDAHVFDCAPLPRADNVVKDIIKIMMEDKS